MDKDNVWPIVKNAELCDTILSGYMIYPIKLELICTIRNNSIFTWFVSDEDTDSNDATTWAKVSNGFLYNVTDVLCLCNCAYYLEHHSAWWFHDSTLDLGFIFFVVVIFFHFP